MAGLGDVASIAQLVGVDLFGLISGIAEAVQTVQRNKKQCRRLGERVQMLSGLLSRLQESESMVRAMRQSTSEVSSLLRELGETLHGARDLVSRCQHRSFARRLLTGRSEAAKFQEVQEKIDFYLKIFPIISHIDNTGVLRVLFVALEALQTTAENHQEVLRPTTITHPDIRPVTEPLTAPQPEPTISRPATEPLTTTQQLPVISVVDRLLCEVGPEFSEFHLFQLVAATNNFSPENRIGQGGFGPVYQGRLHLGEYQGPLQDGLGFAVKRWSGLFPEYRLEEFENEVKLITKLQHKNIVKLLGCCAEGREHILVYELMPNGTLEDYMFGTRRALPFGWPVRFRIMVAVAEGLAYLNEFSGLNIVHLDVKPSNILLNADMTPKITDFGIAAMLSPGLQHGRTTCRKGTINYAAPEYISRGVFSIKNDVYAFGITFLEVIAAQRCRKAYAWNLWAMGRTEELIDPFLGHGAPQAEIKRCVQIALLCVQDNPADRPAMSDVLLMLQCDKIVPSYPRMPRTAS